MDKCLNKHGNVYLMKREKS
ncbi:hypothetical protein F383_13339 [Gossypium arboreum]|uniref:Uncharacterized protein n=1 Tax=Gossypium arboreum TaxID=29729 RepID=A0A0B0PSS7_GOSAR|nr:hypothetical protein F383_13339 [Gossypium arboreum]